MPTWTLDEAWEAAEQSVLQTRSRDRKAELDAVQGIIGQLEHALTSKDEPAKWQAAKKLLADHGIAPVSGGQLLVFSEFVDTARWLPGCFATPASPPRCWRAPLTSAIVTPCRSGSWPATTRCWSPPTPAVRASTCKAPT